MTSNTLYRSPLLTILAFALALTVAACGGSSSDREEKPPAEAAAPPALAPIAVEWKDADLEKNAERIGYGSKPSGILTRDADGTLVFTPQTAQDHVATRFTPLSAYSGDRSLELFLDVRTAGGEACVANLQDQAFNVLLTAPCRNAGEQRVTAKIPSTVTGVRLYFQSAKREPLRLPAQIRLTEQR